MSQLTVIILYVNILAQHKHRIKQFIWNSSKEDLSVTSLTAVNIEKNTIELMVKLTIK